ncbi:MAG TPA: acetyl-CoA carboxylase biotin carboxylase subunit [Gemmataceae bacterium]|nr:acetyl-CoA carboxylase biotin carboxylase subunit [Gemmataceae bacterium]
MFQKVLIANRGEIAVRILRACRELGIKTVAVYSRADAGSRVVQLADESVCIGPGPAKRSYLSDAALIEAAKMTGADALHPGYGFLSEDPDFAEICAENGITFIGPKPDVMARVGDKAEAKRVMKSVGMPLVPGTEGTVESVTDADDIAQQLGYPIIIKAVAGGGGRGIAIVRRREDLESTYRATRDTAQQLFKNSGVYIEKCIEKFRHCEVQILCDNYGHGVHLGERDCSVQRRRQKLIEEAPAHHLTAEQRKKMCETAVRGALAAGYSSAGTVEFIVDPDGNFYFMEINARIQVEHPVSEMISSIDLIKEQIRLAAGERLRFKQEDIQLRGHAFECRINAEDPEKNFEPDKSGQIKNFIPPGGPGTRVDTYIYSGWTVPPFYDSLIAKLIVWAEDRPSAIDRMLRALSETTVEGVKTTIPFHQTVFRHPAFRQGDVFTDFVPRHLGMAGN